LIQREGGQATNLCGDYTGSECPYIQVGNLTWAIDNIPGGGLGGKAPPDWLKLKVETDKNAYQLGQTVTIKSYVENDGNNTIFLKDLRLMIFIDNATQYSGLQSYANSLNSVYNFDALPYGQHADNTTILVPPHSQVLLVRPFYWHQELWNEQLYSKSLFTAFTGLVTPSRVPDGNFVIDSVFAANGTVIEGQKEIQIGSEIPFVPIVIPPGPTLTIPAGASANQTPTSGNATSYYYQPDPLYVKQGDIIHIFNQDSVPHTVTSGTGPSDRHSGDYFDTNIIPSQNRAIINTTNISPGEYSFYCSIHPFMTGKIVVAEHAPEFSSYVAGLVMATSIISIIAAGILAKMRFNHG
jgi:plastocyanin